MTWRNISPPLRRRRQIRASSAIRHSTEKSPLAFREFPQSSFNHSPNRNRQDEYVATPCSTGTDAVERIELSTVFADNLRSEGYLQLR